jgi:hypothetical protein
VIVGEGSTLKIDFENGNSTNYGGDFKVASRGAMICDVDAMLLDG